MDKTNVVWWDDHTQLASLFRHLVDTDQLPSDDPDRIEEYLRAPWKWSHAHRVMQRLERIRESRDLAKIAEARSKGIVARLLTVDTRYSATLAGWARNDPRVKAGAR
jgi:hypothetical protein